MLEYCLNLVFFEILPQFGWNLIVLASENKKMHSKGCYLVACAINNEMERAVRVRVAVLEGSF